jgi:hypothetical protein
LNRRRFLKYAGATAAVVGASALGFDYLLPSSVTSKTTTAAQSSATLSNLTTTPTSTRTTDLQIELFHDYHGDGQQQSDEPSITDLALGVHGVGNEYSATLQADSDGKYWARNIPLGSYLINADKFRYVALSNAECRSIRDYRLAVTSADSSWHLGLMEGFLTLPYPNGTKYIVGRSYMEGRYYDRDPSPQTYLWWNGETGAETLSGLHTNSAHTDIGADYGTPVVASAPGQVDYLGVDTVGGGLVVEIRHDIDNLGTNYIHLSKQLISVGQRVSRGETIGLSGPGQLPGQEDVFQHTAFSLFYYEESGVAFVDPYRSSKFVGSPGYWFSPYGAYGQSWILTSTGDPIHNLVTYWSKDNEPQYPVA